MRLRLLSLVVAVAVATVAVIAVALVVFCHLNEASLETKKTFLAQLPASPQLCYWCG